MFFAGHVLLLGVYLLMVPAGGGYPVLIAALLLHGAFYAATDGVLAAWAAAQLPERLRGSGLAVVQTGQAAARMFSSVLLGLLLSAVSVPAAAAVAAGALLAALAGAFAIT